MKKILLVLLLGLSVFCFTQDFQIIQKAEDGRYYMDEDTVMLLADYIAKLEELNNNYSLQINNLEQQVFNLKQQISVLEEQVNTLQTEKQQLQKEISRLELSKNIQWVVTATITVGGVVYLFMSGGI